MNGNSQYIQGLSKLGYYDLGDDYQCLNKENGFRR